MVGREAELARVGVGERGLRFDAGACKYRRRLLEDAALGDRQDQLLVRFARHDHMLQ